MSKTNTFVVAFIFKLMIIHSACGGQTSGSGVYNILPSSSTADQCPSGVDSSCLTLANLADNPSRFFYSNTTLIFLAGDHTLNSMFTVSNISNLSAKSNGSLTVNIICHSNISLNFINITQVQITALKFTGCSSRVESVQKFTSKDSSFLGSNETSGSAMHLMFVSDASIIGSSFTSSVGTYQSDVTYHYYNNYYNIHRRMYSAKVGGALVITSSRVNISSSFFGGNSARVGGAIFIEVGSNISISNCTFVNNSARGLSECQGGALFIDSDCIVSAQNSSFINNTARSYGGAIALYQAEFSDSRNVFHGNKATFGAGATSVYNGSRVTVDSSCYNSNSADENGGVVVAFVRSIVTVGNSSFSNNVAGGNGGAIYASFRSSITVSNTFFDKNKAGNDGGVMCAHSGSSITVGNSSFYNNVAEYGGVTYASSSSSITVSNTFFDKNKAGYNGGVTYTYYTSSFTVSNSSFDKNKAGNDGGVMCAYSSSSITVGNSSFYNNVAGDDGGVTYTSGSSFTVSNTFFDKNKAGYYGGVMCAYFSSSITVGNSSFYNNVAGDDGGVTYTSGSSFTVSNTSFDKNKAGNDGGVTYTFRSSLTISNSSFDKNKAGNDGGVIRARFSNSITVGNSSFISNEAGQDGGFMFAWDSSILIGNSSFSNNKAQCRGGVVYTTGVQDSDDYTCDYCWTESGTSFCNCTFFNNSANEGGVVYAHDDMFIDLGNIYIQNMATSNGGVFTLNKGNINVTSSRFMNNIAGNSGGVLFASDYCYEHIIALEYCAFISNEAVSGGVIALLGRDFLTVLGSMFTGNKAVMGGAMYLSIGNEVIVDHSEFTHNLANVDGGVIYSQNQNMLTITDTKLNFNEAGINGGVICSLIQTNLFFSGNNCNFIGNQAKFGAVVYAIGSKVAVHVYDQNYGMKSNFAKENSEATACVSKSNCSGRYVFIQNQAHSGGVLYAGQSNISIYNHGKLLVANNTALNNGGALYLFNTNLIIQSDERDNETSSVASRATGEFASFVGNSTFSLLGNQANCGGAIYASESKVLIEMNGQVNVCNNIATYNGGGLYLALSELKIRGYSTHITGNKAVYKGGGIHSTDNSSIMIEGTAYFISNEAESGGGVSLDKSTKLYGASDKNDSIELVSNRASRHGGALYVEADSNSTTCKAIATIKPNELSQTDCLSKSLLISFYDNFANVSGSNIFGELLDSCIVVQTIENETNAVNFHLSSNINVSNLDTIASFPVQLSFCHDGQPDYEYHPDPINIIRGKPFSIELFAYDQLHNPVSTEVQCLLGSSASSLGEGQRIQSINGVCTKLNYTIFTPLSSEKLVISFVMSLCNNTEVSEKIVAIDVSCKCPVGFQVLNNNETTCACTCTQVLQIYDKTRCNATIQSIIRRDNFWITYINFSGYLIYPNCPFDYCLPPEKGVYVNLNLPNGSDAQCNLNRMGRLCGSCKSQFSVSLGSSKCLPCPTYWPGLLVTIVAVFILSGIGLVALILVLNLTVAIGTLNAVIFYANIIAANRSALFPSGVSFASVVISWLNFDLNGFDVCFFDGMDTYIKTWLQLAFPTYTIILAVIAVKLKCRLGVFGRYFNGKYPVATLAIVIMLSYSKLLQTIILTFSSAVLVYPDGLEKHVWLPDATVAYFTSKHAVLFFIDTLILIAGIVYTFLVLTWQLFLRCPNRKIKSIGKDKLSQFLETYHAPFVPKHRYWTGLLLLVRVSVYLLSAFSPSGNPRVLLVFSIFVVSSLLLYVSAFGIKIYKLWFITAMELFTFFNILSVCILTWYTLDTGTNQAPVINISVGIIVFQITAILLYHLLKFTTLCSRFKNVKLHRKFVMSRKEEQGNNNEHQIEVPPSPIESIYCELEATFMEQEPPLPQDAAKCKPNSQLKMNMQEGNLYEAYEPLEEEQRQCLNIDSGIETVTTIEMSAGSSQCHSPLKKSSKTKLNPSGPRGTELSQCKHRIGIMKNPRAPLKSSTTEQGTESVMESTGAGLEASTARKINSGAIPHNKQAQFISSRQSLLPDPPRLVVPVHDQHRPLGDESPSAIPHNYAQQKSYSGISSQNLHAEPPPLSVRPLKAMKPKPNSQQQTNEQDIEMYESVCIITTNPGTSAKGQSHSSLMLPTKDDFELSGNSVNPQVDSGSNGSNVYVSPQMDPPPLPIHRSKVMKPKSKLKQGTNEQENEDQTYYTTMNPEASTENYYESDLGPTCCVKQEFSNSKRCSSVNPQGDPSHPSVFTLKAIECKPNSPQQMNKQDTEVYESVMESTGARLEASTAHKINSGAIPHNKQAQFISSRQSLLPDPPCLVVPVHDQHRPLGDESPSAIPHNYAQQTSYSGISSQNLHVEPPPLPVRPLKVMKPKPNSQQRTNEQDIEMYESVCNIMTNPGTSTKGQSHSSLMLPTKDDFELSGSSVNPQEDPDPPALQAHFVQQTEDGSNGSNVYVSPQRDPPAPLPVHRSKAMKPKSMFKQGTNEQENEDQTYYTTVNPEASTENYYESDVGPTCCVKQEYSNLKRCSSVNRQGDPSLPSIFTLKAIESKPNSPQQMNKQDTEVYESVTEITETRLEASTMSKLNSGAIHCVKHGEEVSAEFLSSSQSLQADPPPLPVRGQLRRVDVSPQNGDNIEAELDSEYMDLH